MGVSRTAALSAEHDSLQPQWQSYEIARQGSFHPVLYRRLADFVLYHHLSVNITIWKIVYIHKNCQNYLYTKDKWRIFIYTKTTL